MGHAPLPQRPVLAKVFGIAIVLAVLASSLALVHSNSTSIGSTAVLRFAIVRDWVVAIVLIATVFYWERLPWSSLGVYSLTWRDVLLGVGGFVVGIVAFGAGGFLVHALDLGNTSTGIRALAQIPMPARIALILTTGITEEIIFRGYLLERVAALARSIPVGALVSLVVFGLGHIGGWGIGGAVQITLWTIVITWLYASTRRVLPCVIMHMLNDAFAFIIIPALMYRG